jgi:hypothetical protein
MSMLVLPLGSWGLVLVAMPLRRGSHGWLLVTAGGRPPVPGIASPPCPSYATLPRSLQPLDGLIRHGMLQSFGFPLLLRRWRSGGRGRTGTPATCGRRTETPRESCTACACAPWPPT